jgi:hypothetical protein
MLAVIMATCPLMLFVFMLFIIGHESKALEAFPPVYKAKMQQNK